MGKDMNPLFAEVLAKKDLSKAGELFNLSDNVIVGDLDPIVDAIIEIADSEDYASNDNDQSVVEICVTRITTAMREAENIEALAVPMVRLLKMCQGHNLSQVNKDEDPPHAKIASDVMSRLFSFYSNVEVMRLAIPAIVEFLDCDNNKDLVRSVASYLSLATIDNSSLLAVYMPQVLASVLKGNYLLGQVLPQIYQENPQPVVEHVGDLALLLEHCDATEKVCFIQLFAKVAKSHPKLLEPHVPQLIACLNSSMLSPMVLTTLVDLALARPASIQPHLDAVQSVVDTQPMLMYQVAQITAAIGTINQEEGKKAMDYLLSKCASTDQTILPSVLQEVRALGLSYPALLEENMDQIAGLSTSASSAVRLMVQQIQEDIRKSKEGPPKPAQPARVASPVAVAIPDQQIKAQTSVTVTPASTPSPSSPTGPEVKVKQMRSVSSQTEGTVTIITVGNPPNAAHPSGTVSVTRTGLASGSASQDSSQQDEAKLARRSASEGSGGDSPVHVGTSTESSYQREPLRDGVQLFCEKHFAKIKSYISKLNASVPLPSKCSVVNGKHKRCLRLHFECGHQLSQCLYSDSHFTLTTRLPKLWLHLMFLAAQAKSQHALSQRDADVKCLKDCWDELKAETHSSYQALVTSSFPTQKDQLSLLQELHQMRYFDIFELNAARGLWACFVCNHPEKISELLNDGCPEIAGQLKEKKGKWKFFKRWKTRYFTLSGGSITYDKSNATKATLPVTKIQSVKAVRRGIRDIPKAFEIFTGDQTYMFKAKDRQNVEQWVQCIHIAVARSHHVGSLPPSVVGAASTSRDPENGPSDGSVTHSFGASGARQIRHRHSFGHSRPGAPASVFDPQANSGRTVTDTKL